MVRTTSLIQANVQHSIAASRAFSRTAAVKGTDMALIEEPWVHEGCIMGLNIPGYTLFCGGGIDKPRACMLARNMNIWMLPEFSSRDLAAFLIKYNEGKVERSLVVYSAYLPFDSEDPPLRREFKKLTHYCEENKLVIGCNSNFTMRCGVAQS